MIDSPVNSWPSCDVQSDTSCNRDSNIRILIFLKSQKFDSDRVARRQVRGRRYWRKVTRIENIITIISAASLRKSRETDEKWHVYVIHRRVYRIMYRKWAAVYTVGRRRTTGKQLVIKDGPALAPEDVSVPLDRGPGEEVRAGRQVSEKRNSLRRLAAAASNRARCRVFGENDVSAAATVDSSSGHHQSISEKHAPRPPINSPW